MMESRFELMTFGFNIILNRHLFQKLKLIEIGKFNYLNNTLTLFTRWSVLPASRALDILLMWDKHAVQNIEEVVGTLPIACKFKFICDKFEWPFSGVYGPNADSKRHFWWEELSGVSSW
jgi:hypothetical protein